MQTEEETLLAGEELARELEAEGLEEQQGPERRIAPLSPLQIFFYAVGGVAGGLVFTMMNNALPLFLLAYTMPLGLPAFLNPGGPVPAAIVGLLTNERSLFGGLIQPLIGHLSDRTHNRLGKRSPFLLVGGIGTAACLAVLAIQPPFWIMVAAVTLTGVFLFIAVGPYSTLLADITPYSQRGRMGSWIAIAGVGGALIFTLLSITLWDTARGWVFVITAIVVLLSLVLVAFGVREPRTQPAHTSEHAKAGSLVKALLSQKPLAVYVLAIAVYWLGAGAAAPFITRFGVVELGVSEKDSFILLLVLVISTPIGALAWGWLADRWGRKRVLQPALGLFAIAALAGSQVHNIWQAIPVIVMIGVGNAAPTALNLSMLADLVPKNRAGAFMGYANMVWSVAQPLGAFAAGLLIDATQSYRGVFIMAATCMIIAALILTRVPDHARGD
ncbi:MAG TPA: MFS transporter [Chloroflexia bacterium]|nr:MFS transporter [Chloroflexia bacterium]